MIKTRQISLLDTLLSEVDHALRTVHAQPATTQRPYPAAGLQEKMPISEPDRVLAGRLMRINHAGEVSAQGLYRGQALVSKQPSTKAHLHEAALEEADHLDWCNRRLQALNGRPSYLGGFWYWGSFAIGAVTGSLGDKISLGFVKETEDQVMKHIDQHLIQLPTHDLADVAVLQQMKVDEAKHGHDAMENGGAKLPFPIRKLVMPLLSKIMTKTSYYI